MYLSLLVIKFHFVLKKLYTINRKKVNSKSDTILVPIIMMYFYIYDTDNYL